MQQDWLMKFSRATTVENTPTTNLAKPKHQQQERQN
jgi:hypothetical protein